MSAVNGSANPVRVRVQRLTHGQSADDWRHTMLHWPERVERELKADGDSRVVLLRLGERRVVLKLSAIRGTFGHARGCLGMTRHHRQWQGAEWLRAAGIPTSLPLAMGTLRGTNAHGRTIAWQWLALSYLEGLTLLESLRDAKRLPDATRRSRERSLAALGGQSVATLLRAGLFNRDHKPSNLVVLSTDEFGAMPRVGLIDPVGVRRVSVAVQDHARARMLASLAIEPIGCDLPPTPWACRVALLAATGADASSNPLALWRTIRSLIKHHGDPRPKTNPFAPSHNNTAGKPR